jgi:phosphohistidine phosphatase SixA
MGEQIILMRNANEYYEDGNLKVSQRDCEWAVSTLSHGGVLNGAGVGELGKETPILHSTVDRARLTAEYIAHAFGGAPLFGGPTLGSVSLAKNKFPKDLPGYLGDELGEDGAKIWDQSGALVVVAHEPLVAFAQAGHYARHCQPIVFDESVYRSMIGLRDKIRAP